jgi:UDP-3-O-[3-hydroxymyristoyl] glucosamine N-acyltransferase
MIANLKEEQQAKHANGGGYVARTATVSPSVYVGPFAVVYGQAEVSGKVRIMDFAQVSGTAKLSGDVWVYGNAWVDRGTFSGNERIHNNARTQEKQTRIR